MAKKTKKKYVRCEDALRSLERALLYPAKSPQHQNALLEAKVVFYFGLLNKYKFGIEKPEDDRRGRPKGTTGARYQEQDDKALLVMAEISQETGETQPHKLAWLAVDSGKVPLKNAKPESVSRRLAKRWKQSRAEK
jgi:hypothetical protein